MGHISEPATISPISPEDGTLAPYQEASPEPPPVPDVLVPRLEDEVRDIDSPSCTCPDLCDQADLAPSSKPRRNNKTPSYLNDFVLY